MTWTCGPQCPRWWVCSWLFEHQVEGSPCLFTLAEMEGAMCYQESRAKDASESVVLWRAAIAARKEAEAK